ncbi:BBE domain-containing protein [Streptomyces sp. NPDC058611]|uniref:BBE domain-containing protein n=1 Tax=unclassified Streptomyces TaxID=2593676 RepID=UPI00364EAAA1
MRGRREPGRTRRHRLRAPRGRLPRPVPRLLAGLRPGRRGRPPPGLAGRALGGAAPWASGRAYQNYADPKLPGWREAYYGPNLPRLEAVRRAYDPERLFRFPQAV